MHPLIAVPATCALIYRAYSHRSLTPLGILAATLTATIHALHPWSLPFLLLCVFFLGGTRVTKIKHAEKARLTLGAAGGSGDAGPRSAVQVLANSAVASVLIGMHTLSLGQGWESYGAMKTRRADCWSQGRDLLVVGIVANYAAVAADTFSSELGILSRTPPRLITSPTLRTVPPGTNGGVTLTGLLAGLLGAFTIALTSAVFLPFCATRDSLTAGWSLVDRATFVVAVTLWGGLGSLLDSFLGGWLQASVVDVRTGKVVEGDNGAKVLVSEDGKWYRKRVEVRARVGKGEGKDSKVDRPVQDQYTEREPSRKVVSGLGLLDNNAVNFLMALIMSVAGMAVAGWWWNVPLESVLDGL